MVSYHIDSCAAPIGANWCGRVTPEFSLDDAPIPTNQGIRSYYDPAFVGTDNPNKSYSP